MQKGQHIGQSTEIKKIQSEGKYAYSDDFVLEKSIFNNIFEKDIRRVFVYKKAERLAKAIHLISPAFVESVSLKNRLDAIAIGLIDAAVLPARVARGVLSRELLALSSVLSIARTSSLLSGMNAELISREAHLLLHEVAAYEEPRVFFDESPTLSALAKNTTATSSPTPPARGQKSDKGHIKDTKILSDSGVRDRRETILSVIKNKGTANIKDISTMIRGISEKTVQRELFALIELGLVLKQGERRWSTYSLA